MASELRKSLLGAMVHKGRGATVNPPGRFDREQRETDGDWLDSQEEELPRLVTQVARETVTSIVSHNESPDIPFDQSINPYRGCEHGCAYCYARPTHAYLGLSPGLDFETRLSAKVNAADALRRELGRPGYRCSPIAIGANTDPYQPIEREQRLTRALIEVLDEHRHPFTIVTKNALVERDIDLLAPLAALRLVQVHVSVTTLDGELARRMEPRASSPTRRLLAIQRLAAAGIPTGVMVAPIIPMINDADLEQVLEAAAEAGAQHAGYVLLRLPYELKGIFKDWLGEHYPQRAEHVMSLLRQMRGGKENDAQFGSRMRGSGTLAELLRQRFDIAARRLQLRGRITDLDCGQFRVPAQRGQLSLF